MTTPLLNLDLQRDEGLRLEAYPDPLSPLAKHLNDPARYPGDPATLSGAPWTIGYGHTGSDVRPGLTWTVFQALQALGVDIQRAEGELDRALPWWRSLNDVRQDVLVEMAFDLGVAGLLGFKKMLADVKAGLFGLAGARMLMSEWADQVGDRAMRLSILMEHGERPA
ncbi:MAG: glycoside hydrolase family protein [Caulobacteraceae bacterium]